MDSELLALFFIVFASVIVFLLLREVFCWYYKINENNKMLKELNEKQEETNRLLDLIFKILNNRLK